jgi:hypothetical protein
VPYEIADADIELKTSILRRDFGVELLQRRSTQQLGSRTGEHFAADRAARSTTSPTDIARDSQSSLRNIEDSSKPSRKSNCVLRLRAIDKCLGIGIEYARSRGCDERKQASHDRVAKLKPQLAENQPKTMRDEDLAVIGCGEGQQFTASTVHRIG